MEQIPSWVERIFTPKVNELIGEVKALNTKVDGLRNEMLARFEAADVKIDSLRNETKADIESLRKETKGDIESLRKETKGDIESLRKETKSDIETLEKVMISKFEAVHSRFDALEAGIPVMEKIAGLELRLAEVERKLSAQA